MKKTNLLLVFVFSALYGCGGTKPYQLPENTPFAFVENGLGSGYNSLNYGASVDVRDPESQSKEYFHLFSRASSLKEADKNLDRYVKVAANTPLFFRYGEHMSNRSCSAELKASLIPNMFYIIEARTEKNICKIQLKPNIKRLIKHIEEAGTQSKK